ncbi:MAG TPA: hypothetical protein VHI50_12070, partial [Micromonosporaceae bacterium]|nr:hypothetical protein [Micromonosporaceae bacterium]
MTSRDAGTVGYGPPGGVLGVPYTRGRGGGIPADGTGPGASRALIRLEDGTDALAEKVGRES